ncbi:TetR/AcrR family transcriptional regulator [bacterium]|nr:TetR/AcrR family transcriptional regulator [bacterium]
MPKIIDKDQKRRDILGAAVTVFSRKGTAAARIADIAAEAGIGKGTVYEYFSSKEEIFQACFGFFMDEINAVVLQRIYAVADPLEKFSAFFDAWISALSAPVMQSFMIMIEFWAEGIRRRGSDYGFDMAGMYSEYRLMIQNLLDDCVSSTAIPVIDTHSIAAGIIGAMDGIMLQWVLDPGAIDIEKALTALKQIVMAGLNTR